MSVNGLCSVVESRNILEVRVWATDPRVPVKRSLLVRGSNVYPRGVNEDKVVVEMLVLNNDTLLGELDRINQEFCKDSPLEITDLNFQVLKI